MDAAQHHDPAMLYSCCTALKDPVDAFLGSGGKVNFSLSYGASTSKASKMRHTLLWRQDPEDSFSDWKIEVVHHDFTGSKEEYSLLSENLMQVVKDDTKSSDVGNINDTKAGDDCYYMTDDESICSENTHVALTNTYHVHRNILASVSNYFRSQFSKHNNTREQEKKTSVISLHPNGIRVFPTFLDFVYNRDIGRLRFTQSDAVALRHLAIYFGVDTLLNDITELILLDFRSEKFCDHYCKEANVFHDDKLLQALTLHRSIKETLSAVSPGIFDVLSLTPERFFKDDNNILSAWRHIMMHSTDSCYNVVFALRNVEKYPDIYVSGAGLTHANGIYTLVGHREGSAMYTNGVCKIVRDDDSWILLFECWNGKEMMKKCFYFHDGDPRYPPSTDWLVDDDNNQELTEKISPAPTIISTKCTWFFGI